jgi:hypothetical protein
MIKLPKEANMDHFFAYVELPAQNGKIYWSVYKCAKCGIICRAYAPVMYRLDGNSFYYKRGWAFIENGDPSKDYTCVEMMIKDIIE